MRTVAKRPGAFAILVPTPGLILLEAFLLWQALSAVGRARVESPPGTGLANPASTASSSGEAAVWLALALVAALLGLMFRWGDQIERTRSDRP